MPDPIARPLVEDPVLTGLDENSPVVIDATQTGIATLTLNRPDKRNALGPDLVVGLSDALDTLKGADHVRVVVLRGAGGVFSAGPDLEWLVETADWLEDDQREDILRLAQLLKKLTELPQLTIALIEGEASGPGLGLVAACDIAVAEEKALFSAPEVKLGLSPAVISPYLIRAVGGRRAELMLASGRTYTAVDALRWGLVEAVTPDASAFPALVVDYAANLRACAPEAVREAKALVNDFDGRPIDRGLIEDSARRAARRRVGEEAREGVQAWQQRRKPYWSD